MVATPSLATPVASADRRPRFALGPSLAVAARRRVLIVNAFFDEYRRMKGSPYRVPRAMGPVFLASAFSPARCEVRLYNEQYSGPLEDVGLLGWPDMLVLTGVTSSLDRMLHLTAYARALNEKVIVVAGGSAIRALPRHARRFFDCACLGDIEQLQAIVRDTFGPHFIAEDPFPRFDLCPQGRIVAYVESSRNCNFRCSFCSLTGERVRYRKYALDYIRRQIDAVGNKQLIFIDNNFYGSDHGFFRARVALLRELYEARRIEGWSALVTGDFFHDPKNLELVRAAGCRGLFSGIESFDEATLRSYNKRQNMVVPQVEVIRRCLDAGVLFNYGIMFDPSSRTLADLRREIEFILETPEITLPSFFTLAIPLLGTPYFRDCFAQGMLYPNTKLRDLDGVTLTMRPLDPVPEVQDFVRGLPSLRGYRSRVWRHLFAFIRRYRGRLDRMQLFAQLVSAALISTETFATSPGVGAKRGPRPTYFGPTQPPDPLYAPIMRVPARFAGHFRPTMVTDAAGGLHADVALDLSAPDTRMVAADG